MTYTYNNLNQLTNISEQITGAESTATKNTAFTYDANGNTLSKRTYGQDDEEVIQYTYNPLNQLTEFEDADGNVTTYAYDGTGMRVSKTQGTNVQRFYWDRGYIVNESLNGTFTASNSVGSQGVFARTTGSGETTQTDFLFKNAHGDVTDIVSDDEVTNEYEYDAYGNQKNISPSDTNPFRYCGEYYDEESSLIYLRNRYYDPEIERFITEDPIQDGMNWYAYCGNNPINYIDPTGNITEEEIEMYENGQMAPMAYTYLMNLTYQWYLADNEVSKAIFCQYAEEFRKNNYQTTNGMFPSVDEGIEYMPSLFPGEPTKEQHYFRNKLNLDFSWEQYLKLQERLPERLKWIDNVASDYHQNNTVNNKPNRKYVSFDGHFELVYNDNNVLLTEHNNAHDMGTYNYANPSDTYNHFLKDVKPYGAVWIKWGNVPEHAGTLY